MNLQSNQLRPMKGIIPPMITPLNPDLSLDTASLEKVVTHLMEGGIHGLFILGTTGEFAGLSYQVKNQLIRETCRLAGGQIPVLVGITDCSFDESVHLAEVAKEAGAEAVVAAPPFYMNVGQSELVTYYHALADRVPLPLFLYNMPSHTKISIEIDTVKTLASHPNIIGLKDSSGSGGYFQALCFEMKDDPAFTLLVGPEEMTAETVLLGGHGGVNGGANLFPSLYVDLYQAAVRRDFSAIQTLQQEVMSISKSIYQLGTYRSGYLMGLKTSMSLMGLCQECFAPPLTPFKEEEKEMLKSKLAVILARKQTIKY